MGLFDFAKKKVILNTFQSDFDKIRTIDLSTQKQIGVKIYSDIEMISGLTLQNLNNIQPQLREKYKLLRNQSLAMGANSATHPDYAYAALMESLILSLGDEQASNKILQDLMGWLSLIGVIKRT
jgi:hypothetical protein